MSTNYPTLLDTFPNDTTLAAQDLDSTPRHSKLHENLGDAIAALEAKVGVDNSAVTTSHDYKLRYLGMTTLGDTLYGAASGLVTRLAGNTTATRKFLQQTGNGTVSAAPSWSALVAGDIPDLSGTYQPLDADLTAIAALATASYGRSLLTLANSTALAAEVDSFFLTPTEGDAAYQPLDADLTALAALASTAGMLSRTGAGDFAVRTLTEPAAGLTISNPTGSGGNPTFALANDLAALEALSGTNTIYYRSGVDTWSAVTIGSNLTFSGGTLSASSGGVALGDSPTWTGIHTFTPGARSSGSAAYLTVNAPADTGLTASTEAIGVSFAGATRQHATGALTTQREYVFGAPTYSFAGASTLTTAVTVDITGAPVAGTNATITNAYALRVGGATALAAGSTSVAGLSFSTDIGTGFSRQRASCLDFVTGTAAYFRLEAGIVGLSQSSNLRWLNAGGGHTSSASTYDTGLTRSAAGVVQFDDGNVSGSGAVTYATVGKTGLTLTPAVQTSGSPSQLVLTGAAHTTLAASTEAIDVNLNLARTVQFSTGALTTQRAAVIQAPTYGFVGASTLTTGVTFEVSGAPTLGTNATITNKINTRLMIANASDIGLEVSANGGSTSVGNLIQCRNTTGGLTFQLDRGGNVTVGASAAFPFNTNGGISVLGSGGQGSTCSVGGSGTNRVGNGWFSRMDLTTLTAINNSPSQITGDQNNYSPGAALFQRWSSDASRNITGMTAGNDGDTRFIWNVGSQNIVLVNESASSTAANRWTTATGADLTLAANKCALAQYDANAGTLRWRVTLLP